MKKYIMLCFILMSVIATSCGEGNDIEQKITGTWYRNQNPQKTVMKQYSWGEAKTVINFTLVIDLYGSKKTIFLPMLGGPFDVKEIKKIDKDLYSLTFYFDRGNFDVTYQIHEIEDNTLWIEPISENGSDFIPTGADFLWYKIDGPSM